MWVHILLARLLGTGVAGMQNVYPLQTEIWKYVEKNTYAFIFWSFNLTPRCEICLLGDIPSQIQRKIWFLIRTKCSSICGNNCGAFHKGKHCSHKEKPGQYLHADVKYYPVCIWNKTKQDVAVFAHIHVRLCWIFFVCGRGFKCIEIYNFQKKLGRISKISENNDFL